MQNNHSKGFGGGSAGASSSNLLRCVSPDNLQVHSVCLFYWYKSTKTDTKGVATCSICFKASTRTCSSCSRYSIYLVYWYKSTKKLTQQALKKKKAKPAAL